MPCIHTLPRFWNDNGSFRDNRFTNDYCRDLGFDLPQSSPILAATVYGAMAKAENRSWHGRMKTRMWRTRSEKERYAWRRADWVCGVFFF